MKLIDVLELIESEYFPPVIEEGHYGWELDSRPQSSFKVTICFMCEEETWLTCSVRNEILIPWYNCEVSSIHPNEDDPDSICIWLKDEQYLMENFKDCIEIKYENEEVDNGNKDT